MNVLCESLPDKKLIFGEFSDEVIQTESRIGAIYLRECEYLNAAEHLKEVCVADGPSRMKPGLLVVVP